MEVKRHNGTVLRSLEKGDQIEIPRGLYSHWAVYVGDEKVVHLTGDRAASRNQSASASFSICGVHFDKAEVKCENFWQVVGTSKAYKNNKKDEGMTPLSKAEIVKRSLSKLGKLAYSALWNNCEHFASWCRYGCGQSDQADTALFGMMTVGAGIAAAVGLAALSNKERKS